MNRDTEISPAGRFLRVFVDVKRREVEPAVLFFLFWFLVIVVFQALRALKVGYFIEHLGAQTELYAKLANIGVALLAVLLFSWLFDRLGSRKLILTMAGLFTAALIGFATLLRGPGAPAVSLNWAFYLFGDLWSTLWVTTFWAYLNEMTASEQSKRLYGLIGGGGVIGGLVGTTLVATLVESVGATTLIFGAVAMTVLLGLITMRIESVASRGDAPIGRGRGVDRLGAEEKVETKGNAALEGAKLALASKYLLAIVMIVFLYEFASQILDYQYKTALEGIEGEAETSAFFARIGVIVNTISVVTQFLLVSFVIRRFGLTTALLVLPVAMLLASGLYFAVPVLWAASTLTIADNGFNYSMNQTARETLFVPTSADVKYKARAFANMFVQRFGKGIAILMALGLTAFPVRMLTLPAVLVIAIWAGFALYAGRRFDRLTGEEAERVEAAPA